VVNSLQGCILLPGWRRVHAKGKNCGAAGSTRAGVQRQDVLQFGRTSAVLVQHLGQMLPPLVHICAQS
jgi:hypothetical protein